MVSRGLDVNNITYVINYDDYIHCLGRARRVGKKGFVLTFL